MFRAAGLDKEVLRFSGLNELIYPLNAFKPDPIEDQDVAKRIRKRITNAPATSDGKDIPLRWFLLLQFLHERGKISETVCKQYARKLSIVEDFDLALNHLVKLNLLLYYPKRLKDVVFCDPHAILNRVTKLVWCSYLLCNKKENVPEGSMLDMEPSDLEKWERFSDYGYLTEYHLTNDTYHSIYPFVTDFNFDDKIFTPGIFLDLLESLRIAACVNNHPDLKEYFMPSLRSILKKRRS